MTNVEHISTLTSANISATNTNVADVDAIVAELITIIRAQTKITDKDWNATTTIQETGIDSFDFVELVFEVEDKYGIDLNFNANASGDLETVSDVAELIHDRIIGKSRVS